MNSALTPSPRAPSLPVVPWRDPHSVSPLELAGYIAELEHACLANPRSADLHTCLGMAYAVNFEVYKSMDALETAIAIDPDHFWSQYKYAELHFRLRVLSRAEEETSKALDLARTPWQLSLARRQLQEIRKLARESTRTVTWDKPLWPPLVTLSLMLLVVVVLFWK